MSDTGAPAWRGRSTSPEQTRAIGRAIGAAAAAGDLVALSGELGAGKTQLVRGIAEGAGVEPAAVASPTFVLVHEYEGLPGKPVVVHIDAYRLHGTGDLETIGWTAPGGGELREGAIVVVEWADRIGANIGRDALTVILTHAGEESRDVVIQCVPSWASRWDELRRLFDLAISTGAGAKPKLQSRPCPICKEPVAADAPAFPFCSKRCRTIDLGKWATGDYRISRPIEEADLDEE
ncbi:MAG: tRNA (adenosine(37)-N6)-threonylcarbamoyltransferase complex ATPase subunit type 1 TsaE [Planctomycetes bacterium]|nr:tRNA (adenosine(37)-N6)-threonylcarbamoyltransferase complex ATPase subunit type 1 TsaE [Planctomycetota bacterium]